MKTNIMLMGIGSYHGDDQVGWSVIDNLNARPSLKKYSPELLILKNYQRPGIELINDLNNAEEVIIIDAIKTGATEGILHCLTKEQLLISHHLISTHGYSIAELLALQQTIGKLPQKLIFYAIEIVETSIHANISNNILQAAKQLADQLENVIEEKLNHA